VFAQVAGIPRGVLTCLAADKKELWLGWTSAQFHQGVELKSTKQGYELMCFGLEAWRRTTVVDGAIMDAPLVAGGSATFSKRKKSKPRMWRRGIGPLRHRQKGNTSVDDEEELYDRIQSEASQHIPFDIADVNLDHQLLESIDSQMDVLLVA